MPSSLQHIHFTHVFLCLQPLTPTDAKPDMSTLRLVKESELRKGNIIGSGAFGTVYKVGLPSLILFGIHEVSFNIKKPFD